MDASPTNDRYNTAPDRFDDIIRPMNVMRRGWTFGVGFAILGTLTVVAVQGLDSVLLGAVVGFFAGKTVQSLLLTVDSV